MRKSHDASESMLGYLFQCRYALLCGLEEAKTNAGHALSIEKFDDIAFDDGDDPLELIQTKHHGKSGDTSDKSIDVWKTLSIWIKRVEGDPLAAADAKFIFLTTATAAEDSALSKLRKTGDARNADSALSLLESAATASKNKATAEARAAFLALDPAMRKLLVQNIWVFDQAPNIINVRENIEEILFYSAPEGQVENFVSYLEGWWLTRIISALKDSDATSIPLTAIQNKVSELRDSFRSGKLPLDEAIDAMPPVTTLPGDKRTLVQQMRLVGVSDTTALTAVHDYYRASEQRSRWARENLLLDGEARRYDRSLWDAWRRKFAAISEDADCSDETEKQALGRNVLRWACLFSKPLRNRDEIWLSSGSFQILSDAMRVGWHPDYKKLLRNGEEGS